MGAEVRALLNQKQEICSLSYPSGDRIAKASAPRSAPGVYRASSQPEELQARSLHLSGWGGTAGVGSVAPVVMPMTVVASSAPASSVPMSSGYVRAARFSTPPRTSGTQNAEILQSRR